MVVLSALERATPSCVCIDLRMKYIDLVTCSNKTFGYLQVVVLSALEGVGLIDNQPEDPAAH